MLACTPRCALRCTCLQLRLRRAAGAPAGQCDAPPPPPPPAATSRRGRAEKAATAAAATTAQPCGRSRRQGRRQPRQQATPQMAWQTLRRMARRRLQPSPGCCRAARAGSSGAPAQPAAASWAHHRRRLRRSNAACRRCRCRPWRPRRPAWENLGCSRRGRQAAAECSAQRCASPAPPPLLLFLFLRFLSLNAPLSHGYHVSLSSSGSPLSLNSLCQAGPDQQRKHTQPAVTPLRSCPPPVRPAAWRGQVNCARLMPCCGGDTLGGGL